MEDHLASSTLYYFQGQSGYPTSNSSTPPINWTELRISLAQKFMLEYIRQDYLRSANLNAKWAVEQADALIHALQTTEV